jgi:hypothetical protein
MHLRMRMTVTVVVCLLVSSAVWVQGDTPVCPCWTAEELEDAVHVHCFQGQIGIPIQCGEEKRSPGRVFEVRCLLLPENFRFFANTVTPPEPSDALSSCVFDTRDASGNPVISLSDLTPNEAAACRQDIQRVCPPNR